jgi:hypothetical protein
MRLILALLVAAGLAANLAFVSTQVARAGDESLRSRLAAASSGVRAHLELLDLRSSPRFAAVSPELIEATRPPADAGRPDDRALRAAAAALQPDPDLLIVATGHGAAVSRRGRAASLSDDPPRWPFVKAALDGSAAPQFATVEGKLYRAAAARIPGSAAVVVTGTLVDDRLAAQIRGQVEADVSFLHDGRVVASSLPAGEARAELERWAKSPVGGYGTLPVVLPGLGTRLSGRLPWGAPRAATLGAVAPLAPGVQAAVTAPAAPYFAWLARYQAFYAAISLLFVLLAFVWALVAGRRREPRQEAGREAAPEPVVEHASAVSRTPAARSRALVGTDVSAPSDAVRSAPVAGELPWTDSLGTPPGGVGRAAREHESLDPDVPALATKEEEPQIGGLAASAATDPIWSGDTLTSVPPRGTKPDAKSKRQPESGLELGAGWEETAPKAASAPGSWGGPADAGAAEPWPPPEAGTPPEVAPASAPQKDVTLNDFTLGAAAEDDPDEAHFRDTFEKFMAMRAETGEKGSLSYEKFAAKLRQNREQLLARGTARAVRFSVYKKDGRAAIKASAVR